MSPRPLGRRPVLDGLRGIAILLVMLMHNELVANGFIGVDLFFGLSGFLITSLLLDESERRGRISFRRFYERRARRLLPGLLLLVGGFAAIDIVFHPFVGWPLGTRALTTLTFSNDWVAGFGYQGLGALNPTWSLAIEDQFYLVWPLLLVLMLRRRMAPTAMLGALTVAIVALVAVVPSVQRLLPGYSLYYSPLDRAAELLLGCAGAVAYRHRLVPAPLRWPVAGPLLVGGLVWLLRAQNLPDLWIYLPAAAFAVALLLHLLERENGRLARVIGCRPLRAVGRISYGLYLYNLLVHNLVLDWLPGHGLGFDVVLDFAITFLLAAASWRWLEAPVLRAGTARRRASERGAPRRPQLQPAR